METPVGNAAEFDSIREIPTVDSWQVFQLIRRCRLAIKKP